MAEEVENVEKVTEEKKQPKIKFCLKCGKPIPISLPRYSMRKYCSVKCCGRSAALKYYNKVKDSDSYKNYRSEYYRKWFARKKEEMKNAEEFHPQKIELVGGNVNGPM